MKYLTNKFKNTKKICKCKRQDKVDQDKISAILGSTCFCVKCGGKIKFKKDKI